jgi:hypothetical protein
MGSEAFGFQEAQKRSAGIRRAECKKMTLVQRTDEIKPRVPPLTSYGTRSPARSRQSQPGRYQPERGQRVGDFVQQKREVFVVQMLIDMKRKDMDRMQNEMEKEENSLSLEVMDIDYAGLKFKTATSKGEMAVARGRKKAETAADKKVKLLKQLKYQVNSVEALKRDIYGFQEKIENFRRYGEFLESLIPEGKTFAQFFSSPEVLMDELTAIEKNCYFLTEHCETIEEDLGGRWAKLQDAIAGADEDIAALEKKKKEYEASSNLSDESVFEFRGQSIFARIDDESTRLTRAIGDAYVKCFDKLTETDNMPNPMVMLEQIENTLEQYYERIGKVAPPFISRKRAEQNKKRRDEARIKKQLQQAQEQQEKLRQAAIRANRVVKKNGRPLMYRTWWVKKEPDNEEKIARMKMEQDRLDNMLYGPVFDVEPR